MNFAPTLSCQESTPDGYRLYVQKQKQIMIIQIIIPPANRGFSKKNYSAMDAETLMLVM